MTRICTKSCNLTLPSPRPQIYTGLCRVAGAPAECGVPCARLLGSHSEGHLQAKWTVMGLVPYLPIGCHFGEAHSAGTLSHESLTLLVLGPQSCTCPRSLFLQTQPVSTDTLTAPWPTDDHPCVVQTEPPAYEFRSADTCCGGARPQTHGPP